jgi:hypothetical protein
MKVDQRRLDPGGEADGGHQASPVRPSKLVGIKADLTGPFRHPSGHELDPKPPTDGERSSQGRQFVVERPDPGL